MTLAVGAALLDTQPHDSDERIRGRIVKWMQQLGRSLARTRHALERTCDEIRPGYHHVESRIKRNR